MQQFFEYSPEVEQAMKDKKPILALESTLITHGLPYPHNIEMAKAMEQIARENEAVPAIIAIVQGKIRFGLSQSELELLTHDRYVVKASTRDLPYVLSENLNAGTTVAATLFCADYAGIKVFATGGIGGVHRGDAGDISADLIELARTPIAVVCSGAKAILDIPRTLEFLESFSVPIIGYRTDMFPAFYSALTPHRLQTRIDNVPALVKLLKIHWQLGIASSIVIANPVPGEDEIPLPVIEPIIDVAIEEAEQKQITGKALTPFLLAEIMHATEGRSLQTNIKLIHNNVKLGAQIAHAIANI